MALTKVSTNMIEPLTSADVGLGNVNNTSDANKPISTATSAALAGKANTAHSHTIANVTDLNAASLCKAWVNFNGKSVTVGAITPAGSYNISSVGKPNKGNYDVTFSTSMPNANYVVTGMMGATDDNYDGDWVMVVTDIQTTGFAVHVWDKAGNTYRDLNLLMFAVFGN